MGKLYSGAFVATLAGLAIAVSVPAVAADPPTAWSFLGIPQGIQKIQDSVVNFKGKHPKWERKPPLKRIADPANLEAEMPPAIKAAAEIKIDQDMKAQKIKAIKFLATVGCGCYQDKVDVRGALVDALADCTEDVRYEAAIALCQVAGSACKQCDTSCCNAETMQVLHKMANGQDEKGCYYESSAEVRAAAKSALNACRQKFPTTPEPPIEGGPKEAAPTVAPAPKPKEAMFLPTPTPLNEVGVNSGDIEQTVRLASDTQGVSIRQPLSTLAEFGGRQRYEAMPVTMHRDIEPVGNP